MRKAQVGGANIGTFALAAVSEVPADANTNGSVAWTFTLADNNGVLQSLAVGQTITQVYTVTVSDGHGGTVSQDVTITITGTNDQPTIVGTSTTPSGGVIEDANVNPAGDITASGTIGYNDIDLIDTHTAGFAVKSSTSTVHLPGFIDNTTYIGTFALTPVSENSTDTNTTGSLGWTFTLDNDDPILQSLAVGQTITQVYTITVSDGHGGTTTQDVTITITGSNDNPNHAPVIIGELTTATGEVVEDTDVNASLEIAADGTIVFRDIDLIDLHTVTPVNTSSTSSAPLPGFVDNTTYIGVFALAPSTKTTPIRTTSARWTGPSRWTTTIRSCSRWRRVRPSRRSTP